MSANTEQHKNPNPRKHGYLVIVFLFGDEETCEYNKGFAIVRFNEAAYIYLGEDRKSNLESGT